MASSVQGVWAIDIGSNALKAVRLRGGQDSLEVAGFDYIEHEKILTGGDINEVEKKNIIGKTLHDFVSRNDLSRDSVAISIAGHNSFARFIKLPPVDQKRIPEIVRFEAVQQIPFDINEVEWDWQMVTPPAGTVAAEVGIFAIKNEIINDIIDHFTSEGVAVNCVQISPMALYNYAFYDRSDISAVNEKAVVVMDMGAENTTLVVCTKTGVWQRSIRIGGNAFTEAIAETFKLKFEKAEHLKRTAAVSKYMRQIFTAMKPVFTDLGSEVQRSLGFYSSSGSGRDAGFSKIIAIGGGMKLQGLSKYLQQTLQIPVAKPESFEKLKFAPEVSTAKFHENICDFAIPYGLAVQVLGYGMIETNLLPRKIARSIAWKQKMRNFIVAAGVLLAVAVLSFLRVGYARRIYSGMKNVRSETAGIVETAEKARSDLQREQGKDKTLEQKVEKEANIFMYRDVIPLLNQQILACLPNENNNPAQAQLYEAFARGDVAGVAAVARNERKQFFITGLSLEYTDSVATTKLPQVSGRARIRSTTPGGRMYPGGMSSEMMMMMRMGPPGMYMPPPGGGAGMEMGYPSPRMIRPRAGDKGGQKPEEKDGPGFVILIEGYCPYKNIDELMDPYGVVDDQGRWGFITRLANLDKIVGTSRFELYGKGKPEHYDVKTDSVKFESVSTASEMPIGIGMEKEVQRIQRPEKSSSPSVGDMFGGQDTARVEREIVYSEKVLVDPMTGEEMSRVFDIVTEEDIARDLQLSKKDLGRKKTEFGKDKYIERDHWFRIRIKFLWKDAPKPDIKAQMPGLY